MLLKRPLGDGLAKKIHLTCALGGVAVWWHGVVCEANQSASGGDYLLAHGGGGSGLAGDVPSAGTIAVIAAHEGYVDLFLGVVVFIGVLCLAPDLNWDNEYTQGVILGVVSAFFLTMRQILHTRTRVRTESGMTLLFYQLLGIGALFVYSGVTADFGAVQGNWLYLLVLGSLFTAVPHFFTVSALRELGAKTVLIITSLMVPYGMILGALVLDEVPNTKTLIGCALVMIAATIENRRAGRMAAPTATA